MSNEHSYLFFYIPLRLCASARCLLLLYKICYTMYAGDDYEIAV